MLLKYYLKNLDRWFWWNKEFKRLPESNKFADWEEWDKPLVEAIGQVKPFELWDDYETKLYDGWIEYTNGTVGKIVLKQPYEVITINHDTKYVERRANV